MATKPLPSTAEKIDALSATADALSAMYDEMDGKPFDAKAEAAEIVDEIRAMLPGLSDEQLVNVSYYVCSVCRSLYDDTGDAGLLAVIWGQSLIGSVIGDAVKAAA